jgi:uncharacterized membrane protein YdjX (TVP38/TMEM64 family)
MLGAVVASLALSLDLQPTFELLREHHGWLLGFVSGAPVLASLLFMVIYAGAVAISVPGVAVLTVIGGYLFGSFHRTALVLRGLAALALVRVIYQALRRRART